MPDLTPTERQMLDLEKTHWRYQGAKDAKIRELFDMSPTIYFGRLTALLRRPEALAYAPAVVNRLLRLEQRRRDASAFSVNAKKTPRHRSGEGSRG